MLPLNYAPLHYSDIPSVVSNLQTSHFLSDPIFTFINLGQKTKPQNISTVGKLQFASYNQPSKNLKKEGGKNIFVWNVLVSRFSYKW